MKPNIESEERKLIRRLRRGDYKAFSRIYDMYAKSLFAYSLHYTKQAEDAEEIVQDVFIRLWNQRDRVKHDDTLRPLLFTMAKNLLINAYRTRINQPAYEDYLNYADKLAVEDTKNKVEYSDFLKTFHKALSMLPLTQQRVIRLSRLRQMSVKEIAEHLSLSEQTVKNQLSLGIRSLRERLDKFLWLALALLIS